MKHMPSGLEARQLYFTKGEIERLCANALCDASLMPDEPGAVRIDRFVEKHFGCPLVYEALPDGILGCTYFDSSGVVVGVKVSSLLDDGTLQGERRLRATVAHEAGHGLMHRPLFISAAQQQFSFGGESNLDLQNCRILCRDADVRENNSGYDGRWWEWQANRAIGALLLPIDLVRAALQSMTQLAFGCDGLHLPAARKGEAVRVLVEVFNVNPAVARIRLEELFPDTLGQQEF